MARQLSKRELLNALPDAARAYVRQMREHGRTDAEIREALLGSGWSERDVDLLLLPGRFGGRQTIDVVVPILFMSVGAAGLVGTACFVAWVSDAVGEHGSEAAIPGLVLLGVGFVAGAICLGFVSLGFYLWRAAGRRASRL